MTEMPSGPAAANHKPDAPARNTHSQHPTSPAVTDGSSRAHRSGRLLLGSAVLLLLVVGCQQDNIASFRVPKELPPPAPSDSRVRLLAAIFPRPDETWFF